MQAGDKEFTARVRIDTPKEAAYFRHGGILQYVLQAAGADGGVTPRAARRQCVEQYVGAVGPVDAAATVCALGAVGSGVEDDCGRIRLWPRPGRASSSPSASG